MLLGVSGLGCRAGASAPTGHLPSSFLILGASAGETTWSLARRRVRRLDLRSNRWRRPACSRMTLPDPVTRNRFLAPECVLFFGTGVLSFISPGRRCGRGGSWGRSPWSGLGALGLRGGLLRGRGLGGDLRRLLRGRGLGCCLRGGVGGLRGGCCLRGSVGGLLRRCRLRRCRLRRCRLRRCRLRGGGLRGGLGGLLRRRGLGRRRRGLGRGRCSGRCRRSLLALLVTARAGGSLALPRLLRGATRLGLLAHGTEHHRHVAPVLLGHRLDEAELGDVVGETLQETHTHLGARLLATAEHDHDLDLVARLEEALDVALLGPVVVRVDLEAEPDLLESRVGLVPARLARLHVGLVLELAVVHELRDGGSSVRGDLDEIEVGLLREAQRVLDADDADLLAARSDEADLADADPLVDAGLADSGTPWCRSGPHARERPSHGARVRAWAPSGARAPGSTGCLAGPRTTRTVDPASVACAVETRVGVASTCAPTRPRTRERTDRSASRVAGTPTPRPKLD